MTTITLPDEFQSENSQSIQIFDYQNSQEILKQEIILNQNTFSFLLDGIKEVFFDNTTLSINKSEFLIMKSGHCLMTEKLSEVKNYRSLLLFFSNEILLNFIHKNNIDPKRFSKQKSVYSFKYDDFIRSFVKNLEDISKLSNPVKNKLLQLKLEEILVYLTEIYGTDFLFSLTINSDNITQKFMKTVESNKLNKLTLKELAFLCNMSISTFKREFEKHYSESPIKWFQNKRLEHANYLLHKKRKNPSVIFNEVGYETLSSFIQAYKSKYGVTPKQHQNN
ncbi:helix-turn-helix domain-containing protein [Tenacibaculum sp. ZS6-P6]|uniref:helix-turn-helix domain-containing protein n=1 Tax=Tenacibaculum sp. ZS6-P6 TaxID=3447503 RepID=UPI003F99E09C